MRVRPSSSGRGDAITSAPRSARDHRMYLPVNMCFSLRALVLLKRYEISSVRCPFTNENMSASPISAPRAPTSATITGENDSPSPARATIAGAVVNTEVKKRPAIKELTIYQEPEVFIMASTKFV